MQKVKLKAHAIRRYLAKKSRSQNWFARHIGISSGYFSQMLNGTRDPSPRMRRKILDILSGYDFDDLFVLQGDGKSVDRKVKET